MVDLRKGISILLIGLSLSLMFSFVRCKGSVEATSQVIHVPKDFPTIGQAIDNASSGATILVASGTYREYLNITKSLSIVGENRTTTIIDGGSAAYVVSIGGDNVTIMSMTITKSVSVLNDGGIRVSHSTGTIISDTEITGTNTGLTLALSLNGAFSDNMIVNNTYGVMLFSSDNNVFSGNDVSGNSLGVFFSVYSYNNVFSGNTFSNNIDDLFLSSESNMNFFYHNNFFDAIQVESPSTNVWSNDGEGNYWASYNFTGRDLNGDGIGDEKFPYYVDQNNQDDYPLMGTFSEYDIIYEQEKFQITIISNSTIAALRFEIGSETGNKMVDFKAIGQDGTFGFCRIMIPKSLMEYPLIVLDHEGEVTTSLLSGSNETVTYLYFTYPHGDQDVTVISSRELYLESELLDEYGRLQAEFDNLNATYQSLLSSYNAKMQTAIDNMNTTYQALLNSFDLLLQNLSQLQNSYLALNSVLQQNLIDQSESVQNIRNLTYIFAAATAAFLMTAAYLSTRVNATRKRKTRVVEEER